MGMLDKFLDAMRLNSDDDDDFYDDDYYDDDYEDEAPKRKSHKDRNSDDDDEKKLPLRLRRCVRQKNRGQAWKYV